MKKLIKILQFDYLDDMELFQEKFEKVFEGRFTCEEHEPEQEEDLKNYYLLIKEI